MGQSGGMPVVMRGKHTGPSQEWIPPFLIPKFTVFFDWWIFTHTCRYPVSIPERSQAIKMRQSTTTEDPFQFFFGYIVGR